MRPFYNKEMMRKAENIKVTEALLGKLSYSLTFPKPDRTTVTPESNPLLLAARAMAQRH
jgi:hypothetical protein